MFASDGVQFIYRKMCEGGCLVVARADAPGIHNIFVSRCLHLNQGKLWKKEKGQGDLCVPSRRTSPVGGSVAVQ